MFCTSWTEYILVWLTLLALQYILYKLNSVHIGLADSIASPECFVKLEYVGHGLAN